MPFFGLPYCRVIHPPRKRPFVTRLMPDRSQIASIAAEECFWNLDAPIVRITSPHVPLPAADRLEDATIPSVDRIVETVRRSMG